MPSMVSRRTRRQARAFARRAGFAALLAALILLALFTWRMMRPHVLHAYDSVPVFRLHVVAHSDAPADQDAKLAVRDAVLPLILAAVDGAASPGEAYGRIMSAGDLIVDVARKTLSARGQQHPVAIAAELDETGPAAVRIVIGAGRGANWFCVLFPPLCFAGSSSGAVEPAMGVPPGAPDDGVQLALRWLDWLPGFSALITGGVGHMNQDDVHADLAHALPRDGHVGPTAE